MSSSPILNGEVSERDRSQNKQPVIIKGVRHFRLENERDVLHRFQNRTPFIRPLLDEITDPSDPPAIVLRHLDDHLLNASFSRKLTTHEVKYIAKRILEALKLLHADGFVHTGISFTHSYFFSHVNCTVANFGFH